MLRDSSVCPAGPKILVNPLTLSTTEARTRAGDDGGEERTATRNCQLQLGGRLGHARSSSVKDLGVTPSLLGAACALELDMSLHMESMRVTQRARESATARLGKAALACWRRATDAARALRDERGAITTEYAVVAATCAIAISVALVALGSPLLTSYQSSRRTLIAPVP
jgi:Flp pilus assembly pilin Flp